MVSFSPQDLVSFFQSQIIFFSDEKNKTYRETKKGKRENIFNPCLPKSAGGKTTHHEEDAAIL